MTPSRSRKIYFAGALGKVLLGNGKCSGEPFLTQGGFIFKGRFVRSGQPYAYPVQFAMVRMIIGLDMRIFIPAAQFGLIALGIVGVAERPHLEGKAPLVPIDRLVGGWFGPGCRGSFHPAAQGGKFYIGRAGAHHTQFFGSPITEVDNAAMYEGAAVIQADIKLATVIPVFHADPGSQRQGFVGGGDPVHVITFTVGGFASVKLFAVPGRLTALGEPGGRVNRMIPFAHDLVGFLGSRRGLFGFWLRWYVYRVLVAGRLPRWRLAGAGGQQDRGNGQHQGQAERSSNWAHARHHCEPVKPILFPPLAAGRVQLNAILTTSSIFSGK